MTIHATMEAGMTPSECAKEAIDFMNRTACGAIEFDFNGKTCTVFPKTDPEKFEAAVLFAQKVGRGYIVDTQTF